MPSSAKVGVSGRLSSRFGAVTASPRTVPALTNGTAVDVPTMNIATSPAISAVIACARRAAIGHVGELEAGLRQEEFGAQVRRAADADRGEVVLAGLLLRERDEFLAGRSAGSFGLDSRIW